MERENDTQSELVDLGVASVETQGFGADEGDVILGQELGLTND